MEIKYTLDSFEGPLDLLLTLIQKNKVSIWDIPIVEITDQYMQVVQNSDLDELDNAGEFIVMASQLLLIKSRMLLPKQEDDDEEDPRDDLARRLAEYKIYKEASNELRKSEFARQNMVFKEAEKIDFPIPPYSNHHDIEELFNAFDAILTRKIRDMKPEQKAFYGIVGREKVSVEDMEDKVRTRLKTKGKVRFITLFYGKQSRPEMIATFLAILTMIREGEISASFDANTDDFILEPIEQTDEELLTEDNSTNSEN